MYRTLTSKSSLETLRKEAKRWLHALRAADTQAADRLRQSHPKASVPPTLRDVQHALAREHGVADWMALKEMLTDNAMALRSHQQRLAEFLVESCLHYGVRPDTGKWDHMYEDGASRWRYAARLLGRHPEVVRDSIHAAAVCGDRAEVDRILSVRPRAATEKGGPQGWEPLVYICYGRLPLPAAGENAIAVARALLDAGASIDGNFGDTEHAFRCLTGVIGHGEFAQPPHPQAEALAAFLIERGADPYEPQSLYNTSLGTDDVFWLDFLYERSVLRQEQYKWSAPATHWPQGGAALNYLLTNAVSNNHLRRARWVLDRGANANGRHDYSKRSLHTEAQLRGFGEMTDLLVRFGAVPESLDDRNAFQAASMRLDLDMAKALATKHPEFLLDATPLLQAAEHDQLEVAALLLDLGTSPDVAGKNNHRPLHAAASRDSVRVGQLLIDRGAAIDPKETRHNGIPLGWAFVGRRQRMMAVLGKLSRDAAALTWSGNIDRLRELFAADPQTTQLPEGTLLFHLPDDEERALEVAEFLLSLGVDPHVRDSEGFTAAQRAEKRGLDAVADLLTP